MTIGDDTVSPSHSIRNLGVHMDQHLMMTDHVTAVCAACNYHLVVCVWLIGNGVICCSVRRHFVNKIFRGKIQRYFKIFHGDRKNICFSKIINIHKDCIVRP